MYVYHIFFGIVLAVCIGMTWLDYKTNVNSHVEFSTFQIQYLVVYTLAYFSDWLKGPYVYVLYESYGLTEHDIAILFVIGFGASAISGPFVGTLADRFGRKKMCLAYFVVYILSALTKHVGEFRWLLIGRVLGGIGTSLLTTTFESWMVSEHHRRQFDPSLLDDTFVKSSLCNSGSAIIAGLLAQFVATYYGFIAPFVVALIPLAIGLFCCARWWLADQLGNPSETNGFKKGLAAMDQNLWVLGITQSLFLGSMYTFVFLWTPALEDSNTPYGLIFSIFMVMISIGSGIFKRVPIVKERWPFLILALSSLCFGLSAFYIQQRQAVFGMFVLFETVCGMMFPAYGSLRSMYIPEEHRTTIMNIYRIPLNVFVIIMLLNKKNMRLETTFGICAAANFAALVLWKWFKSAPKQYELVDQEEDFGDVEEETNGFE